MFHPISFRSDKGKIIHFCDLIRESRRELICGCLLRSLPCRSREFDQIRWYLVVNFAIPIFAIHIEFLAKRHLCPEPRVCLSHCSNLSLWTFFMHKSDMCISFWNPVVPALVKVLNFFLVAYFSFFQKTCSARRGLNNHATLRSKRSNDNTYTKIERTKYLKEINRIRDGTSTSSWEPQRPRNCGAI